MKREDIRAALTDLRDQTDQFAQAADTAHGDVFRWIFARDCLAEAIDEIDEIGRPS